MSNKMLVDSAHPEETRVVVLRGHRVEEFDFESANRKQLRGNIYLAKVTRVEPSLQAAFIDYGGNRHGFLAFSEIHPDYYQIPVADRQALIAEDERAQRAAEAEADRRAGRRAAQAERASTRASEEVKSAPVEVEEETTALATEPPAAVTDGTEDLTAETPSPAAVAAEPMPFPASEEAPADAAEPPIELAQLEATTASEPVPTGGESQAAECLAAETAELGAAALAGETDVAGASSAGSTGANITEVNSHGAEGEDEVVESVGGADALEEVPERMLRVRRQYKIQEVIKRRQVMLVQVVKEERGTKGAALTTYLSLAGRYSVLMPNTARGGGISRKITSAEDRRRLKEIAQELEVPEGMGVILRTAGASRTKTEVKRDFEYLLRMWETVRDLTLKSTAPTLVYEEGSLVKRSIRDLYNKEIDEILVAGDDAYKEAKEFMRMLMPSHAKNVKPYREALPIFTRYGIESQLDAMFTPVMQLRSGGYIVLNQAEALVAIDVNSGRATREHHIEDTALKTNLEAAEEIARQLRLRDLAGLIVIDFIDMDEKRNNRAVERRLKECLRHDRARIQVGHISHFGLLEMSRQRIRSSVLESSTDKCPHCGGTGHVRSVSSVALQLLRALEEMLLKGATHNLSVRTRSDIALYLLNQKRAHLRSLEERFRITIMVNADATVGGQLSFVIEKGEQVHSVEQARALALQAPPTAVPTQEEQEEEEEYVDEEEPASEEAAVGAAQEDARAADEQGPSRRRRRRRRGRRGEGFQQEHDGAPQEEGADLAPATGEHEVDPSEGPREAADANGFERPAEAHGEGERRRRRRGRRGGRRNRRGRDGESFATDAPMEPELARSDSEDAPSDEGAWPPAVVSEEPQPGAVPIPQSHEDVSAASETEREESGSTPAAAAAIAEPAAPEAPRRRSTVREPVPQAAPEDASSPPQSFAPPAPSIEPVVSTSEETETGDRPRRSGWWSRRVLGKS
ncbi:MAG TPA: Rne/Rng family ribonuclease [Xanthobacteraceae bacterium]|nr:Rne/Rng family ribonuclease [Xanthobacteraceae bacterium]